MKVISLNTTMEYHMRKIPKSLWKDVKALANERGARSITKFILSILSDEVNEAKVNGEIK